jgi:NTE family protein
MTAKDRVGLVLGAGGVRGIAFTAGALAVLEHDHGWDARTADIVVGTSAGAVVGALLRAGLSPLDLAGWVVGAHRVDADAAGLVEPALAWPTQPPLGVRDLPRLRFPPAGPLGRWCRRPWAANPAAVIAGLTTDGRHDIGMQVAVFEALLPTWPDAPLWLCAVEQHTQARVAFGRDRSTRPTLAVAASCAVPGYFAPVAIDGHRYVDGGIHSTTNADLLADAELDRVVVVAPLAGRARFPVGITSVVRTWARLALARELAPLRARRVPIAVVEPTPAAVAYLGLDFISRSSIREITRHAFLDTGDRFHQPDREAFLAAA